MRLLASSLAVGLLLGCQCRGPAEGAIKVTVRFDTLRPGCLEVTAADAAGKSERVQVPRSAIQGKDRATVVVFRKPDWGQELDLLVKSFEASCDGSPIEEHRRPEPIPVVAETVAEWEVTLRAQDGDGDGWAGVANGVTGTDCDDGASDIHPGATEACESGTDRDCDGWTACEDPDCQAAACDDGDPCTTGDSCQVPLCRGSALDCATPPGECFDPGSCDGDGGCRYPVALDRRCDNDGGNCNSDGVCIQGEANCTDGLDNDGDKKTDCADTDCYGQLCAADQGCTVNFRCPLGGGQCQGTPKTCTTPPAGTCWLTTGWCDGGACFYRGDTTRGCTDNNACTSGDTCRADGSCGGAAVTCTNPGPQCYGPPPACHPVQGCQYTVTVNAGCNDGRACTHADRCLADAGCQGTAYSCPAPGECFDAGVCQGDGGCTYAVRTGQSCAAGLCQQDGGCEDPAAFRYPPSNFNPSMHSPSPPLSLTANCNVTFSSTGSDAGFSGTCVSPRPSVSIINEGGAGEAVVVAVRGLDISSNSSITFVGERPVILAVYGDARIQGQLRANSELGVRQGAGSDRQGCGRQAGVAGSVAGPGGGGGGGAGFGTQGADGGQVSGSLNGGPGGDAGATGAVPLRGGCPGGAGAGGMTVAGGWGGGALQLSASGKLEIGNVVTVSGAGGAGGSKGSGTSRPGGGGGGSGGLLVLEANELMLSTGAKLTANGGGGGGGANNGTGGNGDNGSPNTDTAANGGSNEGGGAEGGKGGAGTTPPVEGGAGADRGAGGGGGAVGVIILRHVSSTVACDNQASVISPPAQTTGCP